MVGAKGFEPSTLWSQTRCATRLRYAPTKLVFYPVARWFAGQHAVFQHRTTEKPGAVWSSQALGPLKSAHVVVCSYTHLADTTPGFSVRARRVATGLASARSVGGRWRAGRGNALSGLPAGHLPVVQRRAAGSVVEPRPANGLDDIAVSTTPIIQESAATIPPFTKLRDPGRQRF